MLWWPHKKKGISGAFQPKWKGPYEISRLIGSTNCSIIYDNGQLKNVHLNQLKLVEARRNAGDQQQFYDETRTDPPGTVGDLFDELYSDGEGNDANENEEDQWCGLNQRNIISARTRSGAVRAGDG